MFLTRRLLVGLTFFFLAARCLAVPLEDADNAHLLHIRQVATSVAANNTSATATIILATAHAVDVGKIDLAVIAAGSTEVIAGLADKSSTSSTSAAATATEVLKYSYITVTVVQPSLCTSSDLQYSTKTAIPTGYVQISPDQTAYWGTTGSIWNFTLDDGVEFSNLTASCQGSICTGTQAEMSGSIVEHLDGVWTLNVTANMQRAITVSGFTSGGDPVSGTFDLTITSTPRCALPIAQSCTSSSFNPSTSQWAAYNTDLWLANYVNTNNIHTFAELYNNAVVDFLEPTQYADFHCNPGDVLYACEPPFVPSENCNSTQGLLAVWGVMRISNALQFLWGTLDQVEKDVTNWLSLLIANWVVPTVTQKWENYVTAASSIVGILIFVFILIDVLSDGTASPLTGVAVALIVGATNVIGGVANFANGFTTTPPDDTYLEYVGEYDDFITTWIGFMQKAISNMWSPSTGMSFGATAVENGLKGGAWTNVLDPFAATNLDAVARHFFDTILLDSLVNNIWKTNGFYIVFVPYGTVSNFETEPNSSTTTTTFGPVDCYNHWANDPNRPNYISCSLDYGGTAGMTILTQPSAVGGTVKDVLYNYTQPTINYTFTNDYALQSSLTANALYGFDYNLTTGQLETTLNLSSYNLTADYVIPVDAPGLFNLDVCVVTQLSFVPGARQYLLSGNGNEGLVTYFDPCVCSTFSSHGMDFVDYATTTVVGSVTNDNGSSNPLCWERSAPAAVPNVLTPP